MDQQQQQHEPGQEELPKRLPLVAEPENRDETTNKDAQLINCYVEKSKQGGWYLYERPGILRSTQPSGGAAAGQGITNWLGNIYTVFGGHLYKDAVDKGAVDATNGVYRFSSSMGATPKLQLGNGVSAYNYDDGAGLVQIIDVDFPAAFVKGWCFLDGTTYVMLPDAHIQGDDINDPVNWDPLNSILAQIEPDRGVALAKQLVYAIALKQWTSEVFYDAGNAVGSPLGAVQGAKVNYGCVHADGVQDIDGVLFWLSTNRSASVEVVQLEGLKAEVISTKPVERLLEAGDYTTVFSWQLKIDGHKFYGFTLKNSNLTLVYDITEKMWARWTDANGNYFPMVGSSYTTGLQHLFQHESNGRVYTSASTYATDDGDTIQVDVYTPNLDGGTKREKTLPLLTVLADKKVGAELLIRTNDFDYDPAKWTNFRRVDLNQNRPMLTDCGSFIRRAHNLRYRSPTVRMPRLQAIELELQAGTA